MTLKSKELVAVVIPVYKSTMSDLELIAYRQCMRILSGQHKIIIVSPEGLQLPAEIQQNQHNTEVFEERYFEDIAGYNDLMVSRQFYRRFTDFEYILIYQLDAFVFQDSLHEWCRMGFDYVGAPSLQDDAFLNLGAEAKDKLRLGMEQSKPVLNGGLSLRKVRTMLRYLSVYNFFYPRWTGNEDKLFCLDARRLKPMQLFIKIPDWQTAMDFAFEKSPAACYALKNQRLPFGCHAWERYDRTFWKPFIEEV